MESSKHVSSQYTYSHCRLPPQTPWSWHPYRFGSRFVHHHCLFFVRRNATAKSTQTHVRGCKGVATEQRGLLPEWAAFVVIRFHFSHYMGDKNSFWCALPWIHEFHRLDLRTNRRALIQGLITSSTHFQCTGYLHIQMLIQMPLSDSPIIMYCSVLHIPVLGVCGFCSLCSVCGGVFAALSSSLLESFTVSSSLTYNICMEIGKY